MTASSQVVVLAAEWESRSEPGWLTRQVAGALASVSDIHVVVPGGAEAHTSPDGVFTLHRLGRPLGDGSDPWSSAAAVLDELQPERVVVAGHDDLGALSAIERHRSDPEVALLSLGFERTGPSIPHLDRILRRASSVLAVTDAEREAIADHIGSPDKVYRIGAPMAANPSALTEPNTWVGDDQYLLVLTSVAEGDDHWQNELARLLRLRFPNRTIGISHTDAFCVWRRGQAQRGWPIEKSSDLDRLLAWASFTVDLHPGPLFARRCVTSLLYGTPIVVPGALPAREHAQDGRGGLWFSGPSELGWCVEAMLEPSTRDALSVLGRSYAERQYGSTDAFIDRVVTALT